VNNTITVFTDQATGRLTLVSPEGFNNPPSTSAGECTQDSPTQVSCAPGVIGALVGNLGAGNDTLIADESLQIFVGLGFVGDFRPMDGGPGNDHIFGAAVRDTLTGNNGRDTLLTRGGADLAFANAGNDRLGGGAGRDELSGAGGTDKLNGGAARDICKGGRGRDSFKACELRDHAGDAPPRKKKRGGGGGGGGGGCTPGYSPCIPPGPDVDCKGGGGDGPRYVQGPVSVTGSDPYGLDTDNDGVGCEPALAE
jgi:Ca2+-binding RTX toxin-like protein